LRKEAIRLCIYTSEVAIQTTNPFCLFLIGNVMDNSVNYRLEIRFQQTNKFKICASLPEHNK